MFGSGEHLRRFRINEEKFQCGATNASGKVLLVIKVLLSVDKLYF